MYRFIIFFSLFILTTCKVNQNDQQNNVASELTQNVINIIEHYSDDDEFDYILQFEQFSSFFNMKKSEILDILGEDFIVVYYTDENHVGYSFEKLELVFMFLGERLDWIRPFSDNTNLYDIFSLTEDMNFDEIETVIGNGKRVRHNIESVGALVYHLRFDMEDFILDFSSSSPSGEGSNIGLYHKRYF